ncbi:glucokinase [Marinobacterium lutimaris]|uniref:Glucokinase n=1 Tax=Marinobacterium lutimaris TaxID=568106 RepID=A0A1H6AMN9_9GAMM|nr:glucokinase [Marinobacterium lutimaris]SEG49811.1 glucokinase [Marinobacterium lutimaris]
MDSAGPQRLSLVADIGGTNARFALLLPDQMRPIEMRSLEVSEFTSLNEAIRAYCEHISLSGKELPSQACLAIAGPTGQDRLGITNNGWCFSQSELQRDLGFEQLKVINDFTAQAFALPLLDADELVPVGAGAAVNGDPMAVLGPGTGLGIGGLVFAGSRPVPLFSEGGHVDFAPADEQEMEVLRYLWQCYDHVSTERLLCGAGLSNLYQALCAIHGSDCLPLSPAEITQAALTDSAPLCRESLEIFCAMLGSVAGNTALTLGARGGVYIAGGIIPRILDLFLSSRFRSRFEAKGRFSDYLAAIPTQVVVAEHPGLLGAANALRQPPLS